MQDYIRSYIDRGYTDAVTQTALDLGRMDELTEPLDVLAEALMIENREQMRFNLWNAMFRATRFWGDTLLDITHFCDELEKQAVSPATRQASQQVRAALAQGPGRFVVAEGPMARRWSAAAG